MEVEYELSFSEVETDPEVRVEPSPPPSPKPPVRRKRQPNSELHIFFLSTSRASWRFFSVCVDTESVQAVDFTIFSSVADSPYNSVEVD